MTKGESTRIRILTTTMTLINTNGYHATSLREIIQETGVQKGNLYFHFPSKEALVVATVEWARTSYIRYLMKRITPVNYGKRLHQLIDAGVDFHRDTGLKGGCLFGNLAMETSETVPAVAAAVSRILDKGSDALTRWIVKAVCEGSIEPVLSPHLLALRLIAGMEGAILLARLKRDIGILEHHAEELKKNIVLTPPPDIKIQGA